MASRVPRASARARAGAGALILALSIAPAGAGHVAAAVPPDYPAHCVTSGDARARADLLLAHRYQLGAFPAVRLPANLSWRENPYRDTNWQMLQHALMYVNDLLTAWHATDDARYHDRAVALVRDWLADNPRSSPRSIWAWNDHSTALRAVVLSCMKDAGVTFPVAATKGGQQHPLEDALRLHGRTLAEPAFYRNEGNHALDQSLALLEVGRVVRYQPWIDLAIRRIEILAPASIDAQGVTNEQAVGYQAYNWRRYGLALRRYPVVGATPGPWAERRERMPGFLVHATLPNGHWEMLGDTEDGRALSIPGTANEYASTAGKSGPKPGATVMAYAAGFLFARTGWGEDRANRDETFLSMRWGPAPRFHGHADGGSITLYGWGSRLLVDPGKLDHNPGAFRAFFKGRSAHNVVTADGLAWRWATSTASLDSRVDARIVHRRVRSSGFPGVTNTRRVSFSRELGWVVVEDKLSSTSTRTFRQLWHFVEDANPRAGAGTVVTRRARGNVLIRQLIGTPGVGIVKGRNSPVQGWISYHLGTKVAAPVAEFTARGTQVRYLTLLVPGAAAPAATVSGLRVTSDGYSLTITMGGRSERLVVSGTSATITPVG